MALELFRQAEARLSRRALRHNLSLIRSRLKESTGLHRARTEIMAVVKADAYGHSIREFLPELLKNGIRSICVASVEEGVLARRLNSKVEILVLGGSFRWPASLIHCLKENRLSLAVSDIASLRSLLRVKEIPIHLKLDTGMNRLGVKEDEWGLALELVRQSNRSLEGFMTHYASAQGSSFQRQVSRFEAALRAFIEAGLCPKKIHSENSAALFSRERLKKGLLSEKANLCRPGLSIYGYLSPPYERFEPGLRPVLSLVARLGLKKRLKKGEAVSYEGLYRAPYDHDIFVFPIGYADGIAKSYAPLLRPRILRAEGRKEKEALRLCGAICMDMIVLRDPAQQQRRVEWVEFWGSDRSNLVSKKLVSPYELNLRIASRIPRLWVN